jgi:hypothetical protein
MNLAAYLTCHCTSRSTAHPGIFAVVSHELALSRGYVWTPDEDAVLLENSTASRYAVHALARGLCLAKVTESPNNNHVQQYWLSTLVTNVTAPCIAVLSTCK